MIGLVNAAGVYQTSRQRQAGPTVAEPPNQAPDRAPILNSEQAANKVLLTAVEAIQFQDTQGERRVPSGDESGQLKQAELEARTTEGLGRNLDTTA